MTGLWSACSRGSELEPAAWLLQPEMENLVEGLMLRLRAVWWRALVARCSGARPGRLERTHREVESGARRPEGQRRAAEAGGVSRNVLPRVVGTV